MCSSDLNGFNPGLYVMGGSPGVGKTSLALQWAMKAAEEVPVVYVTYENSPSNLTLKAIGRLANISPSDVDRGLADLAKRSEERRVGKECRSRWWRDH